MPISAEVRAEITTLMEKVKRGEKLVSMIDKILALLKKSGLAWSQKLLPHQVGCHPRNCDGVGISRSKVHGLITDILQVGFSPEEIRCICLETDPSETEVVEFNRRLQKESAGKLASVEIAPWRGRSGQSSGSLLWRFPTARKIGFLSVKMSRISRSFVFRHLTEALFLPSQAKA